MTMTSSAGPLEEPHAAIALLLAEHAAGRARIAALLAAVTAHAASPAAEDVAAALDYLAGGLETHIAREEGPLFPRLKAALPAGDRLIDEMVAEHDLIRMKGDDLRAALADLLGGHDDLHADLDALRALLGGATPHALSAAAEALAQKLTVHFENEEELVFPLAPRLLSAEALAAVLVEMEAIR